MMAYADRLEKFVKWYVQLWAESLGKDGKGTTPIGALGPVDQHSQLQLYIAGPRDKLFTVITTGMAGKGPRIDGDLAKLAGEEGFAGKTIGDLVAAQGRATIETLARNGCPTRSIHIETLDEFTLGELLMHFMLETIIAAHLLGVDPYDQPAVEEGKILAKRYLTGGFVMIQVNSKLAIDENEIEESFIRASGPGGQNVNKVSSAVQLRFDVLHSPTLPKEVRVRLIRIAGKKMTRDGVLIITAQRHRSQDHNRKDALERLVDMIRLAAIRPTLRKPTTPTRSSRHKRLAVKKLRGNVKKLRRTAGSDD